MNITEIFSLLGGLALFLYGMQVMSNGLETAVGNSMKQILEKLTSNRVKGVIIGALITAIIQSSSATTVMVVGFVNSGLMTLNQAVWVIMGANIGTTITGQLIALDVEIIAPLIVFVGVLMFLCTKKEKIHHISSIVIGLGVLFIGMEMMSSSMEPLQESAGFIKFMTSFSNPLIGILVGAVFTAVIQSSSASIGILQALASTGAISFSSAVFVLYGQNIGTCITAVLASIGTKKNAKRTTLLHLMFNIIGTILFTTLCLLTPCIGLIESITPNSVVSQIANMHTTFNIVTTLLLLPFGTLMVKLVKKILPGEDERPEDKYKLKYLNQVENRYSVGNTAIVMSAIEKEVIHMVEVVHKNTIRSFDMILNDNVKEIDKVIETEEFIDYMNTEISKYIVSYMSVQVSENDSRKMNGYYLITSNLERIGDHAMNIAEYAQTLKTRNLKLSNEAIIEIQNMKHLCIKVLNMLLEHELKGDVETLKFVAQQEQVIDDTTSLFIDKQMKRMQEGICQAQTGLIYTELLTDFERIGDHALNIAEQYAQI